jgi:GMP synthase-like glutamine amidotransferase
MRVGIAYNAFFSSFEQFFPGLELINPKKKPEYDLIIFSGGEDINPCIYGQSNKSSSYSENRDNIEKSILHNAIDYGVKMLGVCRGHQLINAVLGGSLIQDLYTVGAPHKGNHGFDFNRQTWIPGIVNSMHHQGVIQPGRGMNIVATHKGVIEATASNNIISVQWHPEFMGDIEFFNFIKSWVEEKDYKSKLDINTSTVITLNQFRIYSSQRINTDNDFPPRLSDFGNDNNILFDTETGELGVNQPDTDGPDTDEPVMRMLDSSGNPIVFTYRIINTTNSTRGGI